MYYVALKNCTYISQAEAWHKSQLKLEKMKNVNERRSGRSREKYKVQKARKWGSELTNSQSFWVSCGKRRIDTRCDECWW